MGEVWKDITGYEGFYQVSDFGRVRSVDRNVTYKNGTVVFYNGQLIKPIKDKKGYYGVGLSKGGLWKRVKVHRLVAKEFIPNLNNLPQVNHKDENKSNNKVDNLEWCTNEYNRGYGSSKDRQKRAVLQFDTKGNFIMEYESTAKTVEYGFIQGNVARCARGECNTHYGYVWKYKEDCING